MLCCWFPALELVGQTDFSQVSGSPAIVDLEAELSEPLDEIVAALGAGSGSYYGSSGIMGYYLPYLSSIYTSLVNVQNTVDDNEQHLDDTVELLGDLLSSAQAQEAASSNLLNVNQSAFDTSSVQPYLYYYGYPTITDTGGNDITSTIAGQPYGSMVGMATLASSLELKVQTEKLQDLASKGEETNEKLEEVCECIDMMVTQQSESNTTLLEIKAELQSTGSAQTLELQLICQKLVQLNAQIAVAVGGAGAGEPQDSDGNPVGDPEVPTLSQDPLPTRDDPDLSSPDTLTFDDPFNLDVTWEAIPVHDVGMYGLTLDLENTMRNGDISILRTMFTISICVGLAVFFFMRWGRHFSF